MQKDELYMRRAPYNEQILSADAHLSKALRGIPFEMSDNAIPPTLLFAEVGGGKRGVEFVQHSKSQMKDKNVNTNANQDYSEKSEDNTNVSRKKRYKGEYKSVWKLIQSYIAKDVSSGVEAKMDAVNATAAMRDRVKMEKEALYHLEQASELGNPSAQNMLANMLASGILPFEDHAELRKSSGHGDNDATLDVQADFAEGGEQLARALILWHLSAMDGNIEAATTLGYRHYISATSGGDDSKIITEEMLTNAPRVESVKSKNKNKKRNGVMMHSPSSSAHYGVLGTCETALAYYEAAANAIMDELETSPLRGKVSPARETHKLAEIHQRGASSTLAHYNKPDELDEAIKYYKMRANAQQPDINAAYKVANMYHYGLRGVKQDMREALRYYEIAGDLNSWEAAGQAGKFHLWGMGLENEERNIKKALNYFRLGTPGGVVGCRRRFEKKLAQKEKIVEDDLLWNHGGNTYNCDHPCVNGMGLLNLYGVPLMVSRTHSSRVLYRGPFI